jgi:DNA-binding MarR family transcriptional regulator
MAQKKLTREYKYHDNITHKIHTLAALFASTSSLTTLRVLGINRSTLAVINALGNHITLKSTEIVNMTSVDRGLISRTIKKLLEQDIISKVDDKIDKRQSFLSLTDEGNELFKRAMVLVQEQYYRSIEALSEKDVQLLDTLLDRLKESATNRLEIEKNLIKI